MKEQNGKLYLNDGWEFYETFEEEMLQTEYKSEEAEYVRLPHTNKMLPYNYIDVTDYQMTCCYRNTFEVSEEKKNKTFLITFEGAAHEAEVYLNGHKVGIHKCGYTGFTFNITKYLVYGTKNTLAVKLCSDEKLNLPPLGHVVDYLTYGGIYREVYLEEKNPAYIEDVFVSTKDVLNQMKRLQADVKVNAVEEGMELRLALSGVQDDVKKDLGVHVLEKETASFKGHLKGVKLWDVEHPNLYVLKAELMKDGIVLDVKSVRFGFREAVFKKDGFYLNGKKVKIRGLNRHQSYPYVGYAMPESVQKHDADILKYELGLNAVRTSHYPQSQYFYDRCDEIGLLVFTEIPGWQHLGDAEWKSIVCKNVEEMVLQNRNHASIIIWGVRVNESIDDDELYMKTNEIAHKLDPTRQTGGVRYLKQSNLLEDVYTFNDFLYDGKTAYIEKKKDVTPDMEKGYLISEYNGHMYPTKSFDCEEHRLEHAMRHVKVVNAFYQAEDVAGGFGWCMCDYNTHKDFGSGDSICYHGVLDMFRNPKMAAAVYKSFGKNDFLEISSSMDIGEHPGGKLGEVYMFTNADSVRFYKNGTFIKEFPCENSEFSAIPHPPVEIDDMIGEQLEKIEGYNRKKSEAVKKVLSDSAKYGMSHLPLSTKLTAAKLMVTERMSFQDAYQLFGKYVGDWGNVAKQYKFEAIKDGKVVKTVVKGPVEGVKLTMEADKTVLLESTTYDVACVRIGAKDLNDNILPFYSEPVFLSVEGELELIGPDMISLPGGMGGAYVKTTGKSGTGALLIRDGRGRTSKIEFTIK